MDILKIIEQIEQERIDRKSFPVCAPFKEIAQRCPTVDNEYIANEINKLYKDEVITIWRTINGMAVQKIQKMKINLLNTSSGFKLMDDEDFENKKQLKIGEVYQAEIKKVRNYMFLKKYFALINCTWEYLNEVQHEFFKNSKEVFRKSLEVSAGHCDKVFNLSLKAWIDVPKSIAFDTMDELAFQKLYDSVRDVIFISILKGKISEEEFNKNLINF